MDYMQSYEKTEKENKIFYNFFSIFFKILLFFKKLYNIIDIEDVLADEE